MCDAVVSHFRLADGDGEGRVHQDTLRRVLKDTCNLWTDVTIDKFFAAHCAHVSSDADSTGWLALEPFLKWVYATNTPMDSVNAALKRDSLSSNDADDDTKQDLEACTPTVDVAASPLMDASEPFCESALLTSNSFQRWEPGALVDRLVDDYAGIWTGAIVKAVRSGNLYDIVYVDTGVQEECVEWDELRDRKPPFQLGREFWVILCRFVLDGELLCALEQVERASFLAVSREAQALWSVLYHCRFGPCGTRCALERRHKRGVCLDEVDVQRAASVAPECARIANDINLSPLAKQRLPWKEKYKERYLDMMATESDALLAPASPTASSSTPTNLDSRLNFGRNALRGSVYDGILGKMVSEDGCTGNRVLVSRGRTWYAH
eukprot:TRINITY_DN11535_c0_g2_i1.p1 TRINITY_DN11535_c0_g2~~TRINITY_DN11535_c0_g2_i1.p1  ORF type:complete len:379 (-),score=37.47 TRINITY_DN11535_c0_g2_i1:133-1269(-)